MSGHLRANLWLLVLTVILCSVLYPLVLLGIGQTVFRHRAQGSLLEDAKGNVVGSCLIGQPFSAPEYFQPRPSASVDKPYNAAASGASNWGASQALLRDRVARQLGPIVTYRSGPNKGKLVGPDIETWFQRQSDNYVTGWAKDHSGLAEQWVKDNTEAVARWLGKEETEVKDDPGTSAKSFFETYPIRSPGTWPSVEEVTGPDQKTIKQIKPVKEGADIQAYLFDPWLQANAGVDLEPVPADLVMASASGLDPHITLKNAHYQLERVAGAWAKKTKQDEAKVRQDIHDLLDQKAEAPLGGWVGEKLVNVLEVNLALREYGAQAIK